LHYALTGNSCDIQFTPGPVAGPVTWSGHLTGTYPRAAAAAFGTVRLLLAPGIARRPTVRAALAAPIAWTLAVYMLILML
jgi:hypothetical protein